MFRIVLLVCVSLGLLSSILVYFWIRSNMGRDSLLAELYAIMKMRNQNFRRSQYVPIALIVALIGVLVGVSMGWISACIYMLGAVTCYITVILVSLFSINGTIAATNSAIKGNITKSNTISYRAGSIMGLGASSLVLAALCAILLLTNIEFVTSYAKYLGLGIAIVAALIQTAGSIYSSSFELATNAEFPDETGFVFASSADLTSSFALSAIVAILLSKSGVVSADVFSTFSNTVAAVYPLTVLAIGIVASLLVTPLYSGGKKADPSKGSTVGSIIVGLAVSLSAIYLSNDLMQTYDYAFPIIGGVLIAIILGELQKLFSSDSKIHVAGHREDIKMSSTMPVVFRLSVGMITTIIVAIFLTAAVVIAYLFGKIYGIALMAVGVTSMTGVTAAITWLGYITKSVYYVLTRRSSSDEEAVNTEIDRLDSAFVRSSSAARSYSAVSGTAITVALYAAFVNMLKTSNVDIVDPYILAGMIGGASVPYFITGLISYYVRCSARIIRSIGNDEDDSNEGLIRGCYIPVFLTIVIPAIVGFLIGVNALLGLLVGAMLSGIYILITGNNAGDFFSNSAHCSISSLMKLMIIFSIAFLTLFTKTDGLLF